MVRIIMCFFLIFAVLSAASPASAFYEYVDEHGITRYTDDINEVPEDQRFGKEEYQEPDTSQPVTYESAVSETQNASETTAPSSKKQKNTEFDYDETLNTLKQRVDQLGKEKAEIQKEDDLLLKEKLKLKPDEDIEEYNEEVARLRQKTRELEERREEFNDKIDKLNAEIEAYNEKVANKLKSQLDEYEKLKSKSAE